MTDQRNFQKDWEKIKKQLAVVSAETLKLAKKSEQEVVRLSREGKLLFDETALNMRKEQLYYFIGKEYAKAKFPGKHSAKLKKLIEEINGIRKQQRSLKGKKSKTARRG